MKFLLADDHSIVRMGLRLLLEKEYPDVEIEEAENGSAVMEKAKRTKYDLIILDFQMPDTDIFAVISYLSARNDEVKILIFTMASEKLYSPKLFKAGAKGFVSKEAENAEVIRAIKIIVNEGIYWSGHVDGTPLRTADQKLNPFSLLSAKEHDILNFLLQGKNTKEISSLSNLQMSTISTHKVRIFRKLNVTNMVELIALVREYKL